MVEEFELLLLLVFVVGGLSGTAVGWWLRSRLVTPPVFQSCGVEVSAVCQWRVPKYGGERPTHRR